MYFTKEKKGFMVLLVVSMEVDLSKLEKFLLKKLQDEVDSEWSDLGS